MQAGMVVLMTAVKEKTMIAMMMICLELMDSTVLLAALATHHPSRMCAASTTMAL
jgi:hypothetical protein